MGHKAHHKAGWRGPVPKVTSSAALTLTVLSFSQQCWAIASIESGLTAHGDKRRRGSFQSEKQQTQEVGATRAGGRELCALRGQAACNKRHSRAAHTARGHHTAGSPTAQRSSQCAPTCDEEACGVDHARLLHKRPVLGLLEVVNLRQGRARQAFTLPRNPREGGPRSTTELHTHAAQNTRGGNQPQQARQRAL